MAALHLTHGPADAEAVHALVTASIGEALAHRASVADRVADPNMRAGGSRGRPSDP